MNIEKLIHDLRARINPQYYDQLGTESYERHQVVKALEYLATENERLKELMAKRTREHQQEMTSFRLRVRSQDDATFAALREENERQRFDILAMNQSLDLLREENERRKADAELIEWQPIETAPKDGTVILVMTGETMHVVRWINIHGDFDYWAVDDNKHGPFTLRGKAPTHWMPLPEPPK